MTREIMVYKICDAWGKEACSKNVDFSGSVILGTGEELGRGLPAGCYRHIAHHLSGLRLH